MSRHAKFSPGQVGPGPVDADSHLQKRRPDSWATNGNGREERERERKDRKRSGRAERPLLFSPHHLPRKPGPHLIRGLRNLSQPTHLLPLLLLLPLLQRFVIGVIASGVRAGRKKESKAKQRFGVTRREDRTRSDVESVDQTSRVSTVSGGSRRRPSFTRRLCDVFAVTTAKRKVDRSEFEHNA